MQRAELSRADIKAVVTRFSRVDSVIAPTVNNVGGEKAPAIPGAATDGLKVKVGPIESVQPPEQSLYP